MKKAVIAIAAAGVIGVGGYGVYHHFFEKNDDSERVSSTSEDAVYVDLVSDITGYGSGTGLIQRYSGEVEPQETIEIKLESERTVKECFVKEGDEVKEGQRLFVYDTQDDEDKLAQAEIDIEKANGEIEVAQKQIESLEKAQKSASADDQLEYTTNIMTQQTAIKQSEYEIKTKELEVETLKQRIAAATVTSDIDGIVQKINDSSSTSSSSFGSDDSSVYITIMSAGDYRIKGTVNEQNLNDLEEVYMNGSSILVHSRVDSSVTWTGTITEINTDKAEEDDNSSGMYYGYGSSADSSSYSFYVELDDSQGLILGQHVYMEEDAGQNEQKDGLWLEEYYIMQEDGKAYVWAANSNNVLEKHEITLGDYDEDLMEYEITDGLSADDYITVPQDGIEEGDPVIYNDTSSYDSSGDEEYYYDEDSQGEFDFEDTGDEDFDIGSYDEDDFDFEDSDDEVYDADSDSIQTMN